MDHVVYVQVYLEDINHYRELNEVFAKYFPHDPPARAVLGVVRIPESRCKSPLSLFVISKASKPCRCQMSRQTRRTLRPC